MKQLRKMQVMAIVIMLTMITSLISLPANVLAANEPVVGMSVNKTSVTPGEEVLLTLKLDKAVKIMAFQIDIEMTSGTFVLEKVDALVSSLNGTYGGTKDGKLSVNWISDNLTDTTIQQGDALRVRMRVLEKAELGSKTFSIKYLEASNGKLEYITLNKGQDVTVEVVSSAKSQNVINAENEISKINLDAITASPESLELITNAQVAFSKCSAAEKKLVSNAALLTEAVQKYNKLKEQQAQEEAAEKVRKEIAEYLEQYYNPVASRTPETVTLQDKVAVNDAMKEYTKKSAYVRSLLNAQYEHLKELNEAIKKLEKEASDKTYADTFVPIFLENNKDILSMAVDSVTYEGEEAFTQLQQKIADAISFYNDVLNDVGRNRVKSEYKHLEELWKKCEEVAAENIPETQGTIKAYNAFRDKYMDILMKSPDEVTMNDLQKINEAISEIKSMKPAVSGKLINEYEYLMELLSVLNGTGSADDWGTGDTGWLGDDLAGQLGNTTDTPENIGVVQETTTKEAEAARKTKVSVSVGDTFAIIVFTLMLTAAFLYALPVLVKYVVNKKMERRLKYGSEA